MEVITNVVLYFLQSDPSVTPEKRQLSPITEAPAPKRGKAVNVGLPGAPSDGVYHYDVHVLYDIKQYSPIPYTGGGVIGPPQKTPKLLSFS